MIFFYYQKVQNEISIKVHRIKSNNNLVNNQLNLAVIKNQKNEIIRKKSINLTIILILRLKM